LSGGQCPNLISKKKYMQFEWNSNKAKTNFKKHGIDFADVIPVLKDENAITIFEEHYLND
jgi:uncharacterized DUF497 family protein